MMNLAIVLASSSPYRRELMQRLAIPFSYSSPNVDETPLAGENPLTLCQRLAQAKAQALAAQYPTHLIIGSDQVADFNGEMIGKPLHHEQACQQLHRFSGQSVLFHSAVCLYNSQTGRLHRDVNSTRVDFRTLDDATIERYLRHEQPYDCAGSFKCEGLGIALFQRIVSDDPTSLIGLPLIRVVDFLQAEGWRIP